MFMAIVSPVAAAVHPALGGIGGCVNLGSHQLQLQPASFIKKETMSI